MLHRLDNSLAFQRLKKEFYSIAKDPSQLCMCAAEPKGDENMLEWFGTIYGPKDSPYEGGVFSLDLVFAWNYPLCPPKVKFTTPVYHPNISREGRISVDILNEKWSPALSISKTLLSILVLLTSPNADDALMPDIANLYKTDRAQYERNVREWTLKYAT